MSLPFQDPETVDAAGVPSEPGSSRAAKGFSGRRPIVVRTVLAAIVLVAVGAAWAAWRARAAVAPSSADRLTVAVSTTPHAALLYLAQARGYFAEEGLIVKFVPTSHGKAAMDLLAQGKADLATTAEVPFVVAVLNGEPVGLAATVVSTASEMAVVARRDRGIADPDDLPGKRVGVTPGTSGDYFLWALMVRHRIRPDAVTRVDLPPGALVQALKRGDVDAVATWQPIRADAQRALGRDGVTFLAPNSYTVSHVVVGRTAFLESHPALLQKLVRALLKAERFNREQPGPAMTAVAHWLGLDARTLELSWQALAFQVDLRQSQLITLEDEADWAIARGYSRTAAVPNFLPHLYLDAILAVQPDRVTVVH